MTRVYYRDAAAAFIVFDLSRVATLGIRRHFALEKDFKIWFFLNCQIIIFVDCSVSLYHVHVGLRYKLESKVVLLCHSFLVFNLHRYCHSKWDKSWFHCCKNPRVVWFINFYDLKKHTIIFPANARCLIVQRLLSNGN